MKNILSEKGKLIASYSISRWASEADKLAGKVYSKEEAKKLFGIEQFTNFKRNILLDSGINELFTLACSATAGTRWNNANAQLLVGDATTAEAATQTSLDAVKSRPAWVASTAYAMGNFVRPTAVNDASEFVYECTTAGTSGTTEPAWPTTDGATVADGTVTWTARKRIEAAGMMAGFPTYGTDRKAVWKSSFGGTVANYDWNEFTVRNGATAMKCLNRKVSAQGTKVSGQIWELELTITLS